MLAQASASLARWWRGDGSPAPAMSAPAEPGVRTLSEPDAHASQRTPALPEFQQLGITGTQISSGRIRRLEHNADLTIDRWPEKVEEMRRTEPIVLAAEEAFIGTQLTAKWRWVVPDDAQPRAIEARDFLNTNFGIGDTGRGRLTGGWEGCLSRMLLYQSLGFRYQEEVYRWAPGRVGPVGRNYVWVDYADCEPSAHHRWGVDACGDLTEIEQMSPGGDIGRRFGNYIVPANKILLLTRRRTGSNFEGLGLLRPGYAWWKLKGHVYDMLAIGMERWAVPTPIVRTDLEKLRTQGGLTAPTIKAMIDNAQETVKAYLSHEQAYLSTVEGVTFDVFGAGAFDAAAPEAVVNLCDRQMLFPWGLQFLTLGVNDTGSRAVGEMQASFFRRLVVNGNDYVAATVGGTDSPGSGTCGRLMRWNFPDLDEGEWPRLEHEGLDPGPLLDLVGQMPALVQAGLVTPRDAVERFILKAFRAPDLPDAEGRPIDERLPMASPLGAAVGLMDRTRRL